MIHFWINSLSPPYLMPGKIVGKDGRIIKVRDRECVGKKRKKGIGRGQKRVLCYHLTNRCDVRGGNRRHWRWNAVSQQSVAGWLSERWRKSMWEERLREDAAESVLDRGRFSLPKLQMLLRSRETQGLDAAEPMSGLKKTGDYWDWISYLLDSRWWRPSGSIGGWRLRWNTGNCRPKKGLIERKVSFPCERA